MLQLRATPDSEEYYHPDSCSKRTLRVSSSRPVATVNEPLMDTPELVNSDPFGAGWFLTITPAEGESIDALMDAVAYTAFTEE